MQKFIINGGRPLSGSVKVSGAKNAALPLLAATLLTKETVELHNVPDLADIRTMFELLASLGKTIARNGSTVLIEEHDTLGSEAPYEIVSKMRASIAVMGPLVARLGHAKISMPGGCAIGSRPIDLHIKGIEALSAVCEQEHGYLNVTAPKGGLIGKSMVLSGKHGSSVLATENILMAAVLANGTTIINDAAQEPEVVDLANLLNAMGSKISGAGTSTITVEGVPSLKGTVHSVIPDRIEAGTFILAIAMTKGDAVIENCDPSHLEDPIQRFREAGIEITELSTSSIRVRAGGNPKGIEVTTLPYPLFPTDLQSQLLAYLSIADGLSILKETIYPERFKHAAELNRMGAKINVDDGIATLKGVKSLSGSTVMSSDLRGGAALVIAGLAATEQTEVLRIYHIDRGYERLEEKLQGLGADIQRVNT